MNVPEALEELRLLPAGEVPAWFGDRELPAPDQWWQSLFDSLETRCSPFRRQSPSELARWVRVGAECIAVASARGASRFPFAAYWALRMTAMLLRHPHLDAPVLFTPTGAVSWFLDGIPYSGDAIIAAARTLAEHDDADLLAADPQVDPPRHVLFDLKRAFDASESFASRIADERVRRLLEYWLDVRGVAYGTWM